ncbi:MAG: ABC-F family ATP-binding cassette domain-containing protein [Verrucomicrobiota bacterium]
MLTISGVTKSFGGRTLFEDVTLQVNRENRMGLVGPNGAGKSTFLKLILGEETPDDGTIEFQRNTKVGYLPQESAPVGDETVLEIATAISPEIVKLQKALKAWEADHLGELEHDDDLHAQYEEAGGYHLEPKAKKILAGLSFREKDFDRPAKELSGGWVMRAHLARLLVQQPDLLILDEPTNHLDLESLIWFQDYLKGYDGAILMISHDREFLNQLVGYIIELRGGKAYRYRGNYDQFLVQREANEVQLIAAYKNQQKEIERLQLFADRFRAKASKASQAQSKLKQIDRMEKIELPDDPAAQIGFSFPQPQRSGHRVITLKDVHHAYGQNVIYRGVDFEATRDQKIVLVGPNGAGKSTLLKILGGALPLQQGERELGHNVKAGYYSQYRIEMLQPDRTVLEEALDTPQKVTEQFIRTLLGSFLFRGDDVFKPVKVLSGGEKSRLALVKLLLDPPNLLLMDEPTTHLDMPSIDALVYALEQFKGTLIFISHDVYFIKALSNHVVHVNAGVLTHYSGNYEYYLDKSKADSARSGLTAGGASGAAAKAAAAKAKAAEKQENPRNDQKQTEAANRQARSDARKKQQKLVNELEQKITRLEARQKELAAELEKPETYEKTGAAMTINRELSFITADVEQAQKDWEAAATALEKLDD